MTAHRPLVYIAGKTYRLPAGDTLDAPASEVDVVSLTNAAATALVIGTPVYVSGANACQPARANASGTADVIGFIRDGSVAAAGSATVQTDGILTATTAEWDAVAGTTGGLTPNADYYLSSTTAGKITSTSPDSTGTISVRVGKAIAPTILEISIRSPVYL